MANVRSRSACSTWRCGMRLRKPKACRCGGCWPTATTAAWPTRPPGSMPPAAIIIPTRIFRALQDEMKHYLDLGYSTVKMKIGGVPLKDDIKRIEAALKVVGGKGENLCVDVNGRYDLDEALACGDAIAPYNLRWYEEPLDPLDYLLHAALGDALRAAARHRRKPVLDAGRAQPHPPWRPARRPRLAAIRSGVVLWAGRISAHARHAGDARLVAAALRAAWRASVRAQHCRRLGAWRQRVVSAGVRAVRRLRRRHQGQRQPHRHAGHSGHRLRGEECALCGDEADAGQTRRANAFHSIPNKRDDHVAAIFSKRRLR